MRDEKFNELVSQYLDHEISPEDLEALQRELAEDRSRLDAFQGFVRLRAAEQALFGDEGNERPSLSRVRQNWDPVDRELCASRRFVRNLGLFCLSLALIIALACQWMLFSDDDLDAEELAALSSPVQEPANPPEQWVELRNLQQEGTETIVLNLRWPPESEGSAQASVKAANLDDAALLRVFTFSAQSGLQELGVSQQAGLAEGLPPMTLRLGFSDNGMPLIEFEEELVGSTSFSEALPGQVPPLSP
ncbi:MAG: hypothetical protein ACFB21_13195 [Opitutales bacterium]